MTTTVYVIGLNNKREFGQSIIKSVTFTEIGPFDSNSSISRVYCGDKYTIYTDEHRTNIFYAGSEDAGFPHPSSIQHPVHKLDYFQKNQIQIRRIYTNLNGLCTFWLTSDWKLYGMGPIVPKDESSDRPHLVEGVKNVIDIQSSFGRSNAVTALCSKNSDSSLHIIRHWTRQHGLALLIPGDILNLLVSFCSINAVFYKKTPSEEWKELSAFESINITKIAVGVQHQLFLTADGEVYGRGTNDYGRIGSKDQSNHMFPAFKIPLEIKDGIPDSISEKVDIIHIRCGWNHNLLLDRQGRVYSFGKNRHGQCAQQGSAVYGAKVIQWFEDRQERVEHIDCGMYHSYCRTTEGKHYLFGANGYNECCAFNRRTKVRRPFCVNDVIAEKLKGSRVKSIVLGQQNTRIVMYD